MPSCSPRGAAWLAAALPKGFFPVEDTGLLSVSTEGPRGASIEAMARVQARVAEIIQASPHVVSVVSSVGAVGGSASINQGRMFVQLTPRAGRPGVAAVIHSLRFGANSVPGMRVFLQPIQNLAFGARPSRTLYTYTLQGLRLDELHEWALRPERRLAGLAVPQDVNTDLQLDSPVVMVNVDRDRAAASGVSVEQVRQALHSAFGARQISTIYGQANAYPVILEALPEDQRTEEGLAKLHIRASTGRLVPLSALATIERRTGPLTIGHQGQLPAMTIGFNTAPGVALGDAVRAIQAAEREMGMPPSIVTGFPGSAQVFQRAAGGQWMLVLAAVLVMDVALGVLCESLVHPLMILSGLPATALGAFATLRLFGLDLSVIAVIGVLLVIGLVKQMRVDLGAAEQAGEARRVGAGDVVPRAALAQRERRLGRHAGQGQRQRLVGPARRVLVLHAREAAMVSPLAEPPRLGPNAWSEGGKAMAPLDRHARAVLEMAKQAGRPRFETLPPEAARAQYAAGRAVLQPPAPHVAEVREVVGGPVPMRLYRPAPGPLAALVFLHGGGWVMGGLDTHDHMARTLALGAGCAVLAVDYRLAPEHRFPAAVEDAAAALRFAHARAGQLGLDPARIGVGGDSAGGNLAAVLALMGRDGGLPAPRFQLLLYPVTDLAEERGSYASVAPDLALTAPTMRWFRDHCAPEPGTWADWRLSPLRAPSLAGVCPAFVLTCGHDPLRDEGRDYAARLEREGVAVTALHLADQMHGFLTMGALVPAAGFALEVAARALRVGLA